MVRVPPGKSLLCPVERLQVHEVVLFVRDSNRFGVSKGTVQGRCMQHLLSLGAVSPAGESKLANVLFAKELARREAGGNIKAYSLHPGEQRLLEDHLWTLLTAKSLAGRAN